MVSMFGVLLFFAIAVFLSEDRKKIDYKSVAIIFGIQIAILFCVAKVHFVQRGLIKLCDMFGVLKTATVTATSFVFGYIGGAEVPFQSIDKSREFILAFQGLPIVIVVAAISMVLFHFGVMQCFIRFITKIFGYINVKGITGFFASLKLIMSYTDIAVMMKGYVSRMSRNEMMSVFMLGLSTTSVTIFCILSTMANNLIDNSMMHIVLITVVNIFTSIIIAKIIVPSNDVNCEKIDVDYKFDNVTEAISYGAKEGAIVVFNIMAMLIAIIGVIYVVNAMLGMLPAVCGYDVSLESILSVFLYPFVLFTGVPLEDAMRVSMVIAKKIILNEIVAVDAIGQMKDVFVSSRSMMLAFYMICNFANISSLSLTAAIYTSFCADKKQDISSLSLKAFVGAMLVSFITAAIMNIVLL